VRREWRERGEERGEERGDACGLVGGVRTLSARELIAVHGPAVREAIGLLLRGVHALMEERLGSATLEHGERGLEGERTEGRRSATRDQCR
jgi:hypothetical protein